VYVIDMTLNGLIFNIQKFSLHDGPGIRTSVFFQGCNLRCKWCSNPESFELHPLQPGSKAKEYTVEDLMAELVKDKAFYDASGGGVTFTGGEALMQQAFALALCDALGAEGIGVTLETSANAPGVVFRTLLEKCSFVYIDLKHYDNEAHIRGCGSDTTHILENIRTALDSDIPTTIRIPVIPGFNDSSKDMEGFAVLLKEIGASEVHLLPFHQMGEYKYNNLGLSYDYAGIPSLHDKT